jgi:hypothetical protein
MALQCKINYDQNGQIDYIETDNGQRSKLFDDLVKLFGGDKNLALDYYALTEDKEFQAVYGKDEVRFSIAGERGIANLTDKTEAERRLKDLSLAVEMGNLGVKPLEIKQKTGWEKNKADGKWRFEIPDGGLKRTSFRKNKEYNLSEVLDSELSEMYPNIKVKIVDNADRTIGGGFNSTTNTIEINSNFSEYQGYEGGNTFTLPERLQGELFRAILHEATHATQSVEGFGRGGSPQGMAMEARAVVGLKETDDRTTAIEKANKVINGQGYSKLDKELATALKETLEGSISEDPFQKLYERISGEVEAKAVEYRSGLFLENLRDSLMSRDFNISEEDQIFLSNSLGISAISSPQKINQELIDKLKQNGLSEDVFLMSTQEIDDKLELNEKDVKNTTNGFVYNNQVFLNKDIANNSTLLHEYNHLFNSWLKENRKELYNKGVDLVKAELEKENSDIQDIINYVHTTQPDLKGEAFYEEVLAEITGKRGSELLNSKKKSGIIDWIREFWNEIKDMLGLLEATPEQVSKMTLKDFADASAVQMMKGENFVGKEGGSNFSRWKGSNELVSSSEIRDIKTGQPIVAKVYHGTTNEFYEFDASVKGNIEGHLGKVNYFTSDYQDANQNYLSEGADITGRIDRRQDELEDTLRYDYQSSEEGLNFQQIIDDFNITEEEVNTLYPSGQPEFIQAEEISRFLAEKELKGTEEKVLELYVKLNNPVVLGNGATWFDALEIDEVYLEEATQEIAEEYDITEEEAKNDYEWEIRDRAVEKQGDSNKIVEALEEALDDNGYDSSLASDILGDNYYEAEVDLNKLEQDLRNAELYENYDNELASSQVIADFFKKLGFDGIILTDVAQRFRNMGLSGSTSHIHVFDEFNNQIKLADGSNVTFGETSNIRFSKFAQLKEKNIKEYENKQLSPREEQRENKAGRVATEATNFLRAKGRTNQKNSSDTQKLELEDFAKSSNLWVENYDKLGEYIDKGMESQVYLSKNGSKLYKINDLEFYDTPVEFLESLDLHNTLFPESAYTLIGFTRRVDTDNFSFILEQPFIEADRGATQEETEKEMNSLGFTRIEENTYSNGEVTVEDLHQANVLYKDGSIFIIDPVIRLNGEITTQKTPSVKDVVNYAQADGKELTIQEKIELQDTIMSLGVNSSYQAEEMLRQALVTEGLISFNRNKMIDSGAFNSYEVSMILNSAEKQQKLRDVYQALKNTEEIVVEYDKNFVNKKAELNSFGKQVVLNPFILEEQILDTLEIPEGVEYEIPEGLRQAKQLDVNGNQKTEGTDTKDILELSYIDDYNETMAENIDFITNGFSANVWESKKDAVAKIVKQIKKDAANNGIDLKDIEAKVYSKSRAEIINFFNALEDFLETGDATVFAEAYNEMFDLNKPLTQTIYSDNNADVVINEPISEYKAFTELNLVKKSPTVYRKVKSLPLEQMYEIVATNKKKSVEEVQLEVRNSLTDVSDFEVDMESLEKITLWKDYFNFPKNSPELVVEKQDAEEVKKMNKKILKSNNPYLKTTKNGIEYVNEDPLTISRAEMTLPRKKEETAPIIEEDLLKAKRERALTNPKSINKLNSDYVYLQDNLVAVKNTSEDFIRTPRGIFEIVGKEGNLTFFQKVESLEKPMTEVNLESFNYLQTKPEVFMQAKKYYTKAELEKINKENFSCN